MEIMINKLPFQDVFPELKRKKNNDIRHIVHFENGNIKILEFKFLTLYSVCVHPPPIPTTLVIVKSSCGTW